MPYDRPRQPGEDVVQYGIATQRIAASSADSWRKMLSSGGVDERFVESLATPFLPDPQAPAVKPRQARPVAASAGNDTVTPELRAKMTKALGLPVTATRDQIFAALEATKKAAPQVPVAASTPVTQPLVNADLNPAVFELARDHKQMYADALTASRGTVPTLFPGGDLPASTASGIDPQRLGAAHWTARHAIAAAADPQDAEELLQLAAGPEGEGIAHTLPEVGGHPGVRDYLASVRAWAEAGNAVMRVREEDQQIAASRSAHLAAASAATPSIEEDYESLFGPLVPRGEGKR